MRKKILILGSSGFIGKKISKNLKKYFDIFTSHHNYKRKKWLNNFLLFEKYIKKKRINFVINLIREKSFEECKKINQNLIRLAKNQNLKIIYLSTSLIYGNHSGICDENCKLKPYDKYTKLKYLGEKLYLSSKINYKIVRLSNVYGDDFKKIGLIRNIYLALISEDKEFFINNPNIIRNFIHYRDFLRMLKLTIMKYDKIEPKIINFGNENIKIKKLITIISKIYGNNLEIKINKNKIFDPSIKISNRLNNKIFNLKNKVNLFNHIKQLIK